MSTVSFACPHCHAKVRATTFRDEQGRLRAACPECGGAISVRPPTGAPPEEPASPVPDLNKPQEFQDAIRAPAPFPRKIEPPEAQPQRRKQGRPLEHDDVRRPTARRLPWALIIGGSVAAVLLTAGLAGLWLWHVLTPRAPAAPAQAHVVHAAPVVVPPLQGAAPAAPQQPPELPLIYTPVPQEERAKVEARRRARRAWERASTVEAYQRVGHKDPKWDAAALGSLEAAARLWTGPLTRGHDRVASWRAAKRAIDAGCDDPYIRYLYVRLGHGLRTESDEDLAAHFARVADALEASDYPAARKAHAHNNAAASLLRLPLTPERKEQALRRLDACVALVPEILKGDAAEARQEVFDLCLPVMENFFKSLGDREKAIARVTAVLERNAAWRPLLLCVRATGYIQYGWEARGTGLANTVTPEGWRLFDERLRHAEKDLLEAWELAPDFYPAANKMQIVGLGLSWEPEEVDVWFQRAMKANADNIEACLNKLYYFEPKWHGKGVEILVFGRKCRDTANWEGRLPFVLVAAHEAYARYFPPGQHFRHPGTWKEIQPIYEAFLKLHPESKFDRAMYAKWAYECGQYEEAQRLFAALGEDDWVDVFSSVAEYQQALADVRNRVAAPNP
jgi:hypothetical protein